MLRFDRRQLLAFMHALDRRLPRVTEVVIIGGAAAALAHDSGTRTADIDLWQGLTSDILAAAEQARKDTGLAIAVSAAAVADLPHNYQERLRPGRGLRLKTLRAWFPDKYDLALAKIVRGYQHDLDAIAGIHRRHRLAASTLVNRFESEMGSAVADPARVRLNMAMLAARLYGQREGQRLAQRWGVPIPRPR
jgi:hypothetical protein